MNINQTACYILKKRPVLKPVLEILTPLWETQEKIDRELCERLPSRLPFFPQFDSEHAQKGIPVLTFFPAKDLFAAFEFSVNQMLPVLENFPILAPYKKDLKNILRVKGIDIINFFLTGAKKTIFEDLAGKPVPKETLFFLGEWTIAPVFRALANVSQLAAQKPWDREGAWLEGYCPFCGSFPSLAWLDKPVIEEQNAFLSGGGGKKHFHCQLCNCNWIFMRSVCPACGKHGSGTVEILHETGSKSERIDYCSSCKVYHVTIDLRGMIDSPQPDVMAAGLMHLDMIASQKKLIPLKSSCWNTF